MSTEHPLTATTVTVRGDGGDPIEAYLATVLDEQPRGGVVVIHHMPGYDRETKEFVRRFASMGFNAVCPNLYSREAPGAAPDDAAALVRAAGGVPDDRLVEDIRGAADHLRSLPTSNGRVGVIGHCSGGRQAFLSACSLRLDAAVSCYPGFVVEGTPEGFPVTMRPVLGLAAHLSCPLLGLFGNDDRYPSPPEVDRMEEVLQAEGKEYAFHRYDGAGHSFFSVDRPAYRVEAALDGWRRIEQWFTTHLSPASG